MLSAAFHGGVGAGADASFSPADKMEGQKKTTAINLSGTFPIELRAGYRMFLKNAGWFVDPVLCFKTAFAAVTKDSGSKFAFSLFPPFKFGSATLELRIGKVINDKLSVYAICPSPEMNYSTAPMFTLTLQTGAGVEYKLHRNVSLTGALRVKFASSFFKEIASAAVVGFEFHQSNYYGD